MNFLYCSQRQREMHLLKQRRLKHILSYNQQEMERKRKQKTDEQQNIKQNSRIINQQALHSLMTETHQRQHKFIEQRNMLKETYERQMKEREDKMKMEKIMDREYFQRQREHMDFEESRRIMELERMYNRATYEAYPFQGSQHRRIKTQIEQPTFGMYKDKPTTTQTPNARQGRQPRSLDMKQVPSSEGPNRGWKIKEGQGNVVRDSLDDLNAEQIRYPRNGQSMKNVIA